MIQDKLKIVILGGGTAGWMTANLMAARWKDKNIQLTVVESPDVGIVGVGEGSTPSLQNFFQEIGVTDSEWMPECNATYKNGITFEGWSSIAGFDKYCHPFPSQMDVFTLPKFENNCHLRRHNFDVEAHPDRFFLGSFLSQNKRSPKANDNFPFDHANGYHFDSNLLGEFLSKKAIERGVEYLQRHVVNVNQNEQGDILSLNCKDSGFLEADFFVDCTGFAGLLLQKTLKTPFINLDKVLFNDRAIVAPTPSNRDNLSSQTRSTALKHGWAWDIPLINRTGNGYVFSSKYCSENDAETEFREHLGLLDSDVECRTVKWKQGRVEQHWNKNCLAIGLSQGFMEPIEAMSLHLVYTGVGHFISEFEKGGFSNQNQQQYNAIINRGFDAVIDYIVAHYRMNSRRGTEYWRDNANNQNVSSSFVSIVQSWLGSSDVSLAEEIKRLDVGIYFPVASWQILFAGYGVFPQEKKPKISSQNINSTDMKELADFIKRCGSNYPHHLEALNKLV